jgi:hypothetical protein
MGKYTRVNLVINLLNVGLHSIHPNLKGKKNERR